MEMKGNWGRGNLKTWKTKKKNLFFLPPKKKRFFSPFWWSKWTNSNLFPFKSKVNLWLLRKYSKVIKSGKEKMKIIKKITLTFFKRENRRLLNFTERNNLIKFWILQQKTIQSFIEIFSIFFQLIIIFS